LQRRDIRGTKKTVAKDTHTMQGFMKYQTSAVAVTVAVVGCATPHLQPQTPRSPVVQTSAADGGSAVPLSSQDYIYQLWTPDQTGLMQVFDDGHNTYVTFAKGPLAGLMIFDENGKPVAYTLSGSTAVVAAVHRGLLLRTPTKSSYAQTSRLAGDTARVAANNAVTGQAAPLPADLAAARAEILRAQDRLNGLAAALDETARGEAAPPIAQIRAEIEEIQTTLNGIAATLVRTHFATGSALLALSDSAKDAILAAATRADHIQLRGGADSTGSPEVNAKLALHRALNVEQWLIDGGVPATKIRVTYNGTEYIAANNTATGRAKNRRVDVVLFSATNERIHVLAKSADIGADAMFNADIR
jgi:outer membrane protein OmpA-like peptidoglycan-associated protein